MKTKIDIFGALSRQKTKNAVEESTSIRFVPALKIYEYLNIRKPIRLNYSHNLNSNDSN